MFFGKIKFMRDKILQTAKTYLPLTILGGVLIVAIIFLTLFFLKPAKPPQVPPSAHITPPVLNGKKLPQNTKLLIRSANFPASLPVYQKEKKDFPEEQAIKIAQYFGFNFSPKREADIEKGRFLIWATDESSLTIALDSPMVDFILNLWTLRPNEDAGLLDFDRATDLLNTLLDRTGLERTLLQTTKRAYFRLERGALLKSSPQEADFIQAGSYAEFKRYPLLSDDPMAPAASLIIGGNDQVVRFYYQPPSLPLSEDAILPLKNFKQIASFIREQGVIVSFDVMSKEAWDIDFREAQLDQISLAYLSPRPEEKDTLIQPLYVLTGKGILEDGRETEIVVYLPAIAY